MNFYNKKTRRIITVTIVLVLVAALVISLVAALV
jgi:hypothetical protein